MTVLHLQHRGLRRAVVRLAKISALLAVTTSHAAAQAKTLVGSVRDDLGQPVAGARVNVRGVKGAAISDSSGRFALPGVSAGLMVVTARGTGLFPMVELARLVETDTLALVLKRLGSTEDSAALVREAETEITRIGDRYERSAGFSRSAKAFTDRDIARRAPAVTTDLFVGLIGFTVDGIVSDAGVTSLRDGCYPTVWVDEIERPHMNLNEIRPSAIKLLLAWNGYALIPARLRSVRTEPTCGAVLILMAK